MLYDYGALEMWVTSTPVWAAPLPEDCLEEEITSAANSESESTLEAVTLGFVISLLLLGIGTLAWGTTKVMEGSMSLNQRPAPIQVATWIDLK